MLPSFLSRRSGRRAVALPLAWTLLALPVAVPVLAQPAGMPAPSVAAPAPAALTLGGVWRAALTQDPTLRAAIAAEQSGRELLPQARALLRPQVSLSLGVARNGLDSATPDINGNTVVRDQRYNSGNATLGLRQPLLAPVQRAAVRQADARGAEAEALLEQSRQELAARVAQAYFELLLSEDQIVLVQAQTKAHATQLDAANKALAAGSGMRTDIDEAKARIDLDLAQELEARQQRELSQRRLQQLVGGAVGRVASLDVDLLRRSPPQPGALEDWLALAQQRSPELQVLRARRDAAVAEVDKARARHLPTIDAVGQVARGQSIDITRISSRTTSTSIGLQLNVPLYAGGALESGVRQAVAEQMRSEELLAALWLDISLRLHREYRGVTEGLLRMRALEQAVASSQQAVTSSRRSFQAGSRSTLDVLNTEQQLAVARRDLAQSRYSVLLSLVRLQSAAGAVDEGRLSQLDAWLTDGRI